MLHIITLHIRQQSHYITTLITIIFESNIFVSLSTPFETIRLTRIIERSLKHIIEEVLRDLKKTIRDFVVGVTSYRRKIGHEWFQHSVTGARDRRECCNSVKDLSFRKIGEKIDQDDFSFEVERHRFAIKLDDTYCHQKLIIGTITRYPNLVRCFLNMTEDTLTSEDSARYLEINNS